MSKYYNPESLEDFGEAKIINGTPSGVLNFNKTPHKWGVQIYRMMEGYTWFPEECHLAQDKVAYQNLIPEKKYAYDMALGQLIADDSMQATQLVGSISSYITSPVINACLTRQAYEETNHSRTYAVAADEVCQDSDRIYNLHKTEPALARKNLAVSSMYEEVNSDNPGVQELLVAFAANQILEELVFPGGFITLWSLGMPGTCKAISFIERDEKGTHVPLFKNIFATAKRENTLEPETQEKILQLIGFMADEEKIWTKHITKKLLGFSPGAVDLFVEFQANSVCDNLKLPPLYERTDGGPLISIVDQYSMLSSSKKKTNFFEQPVGDYTVNGLDDDY